MTLVPLTPTLAEAAAPVVAPMILQFFVLTVLWVGTLPACAPKGPGARFWGAVLLPFLMISTGLLFFSAPLAPLWQPVLGAGGTTLSGFPAGFSLGMVLLMNLGVVGWCIRASGGLRESPFVPLLVVIPVLVGLMGGGFGGTLIAALGAGVLLLGLRYEEGLKGTGMAPTPARWMPAFWIAALVLVVLAFWLAPR